MKKVKDENKILIMLAFFSISIGLWGNFRQLWLQDNSFSVTQISNIISIGTFISVIGNNEIKKVEQLMSNIKENTCKVPYGINDEKRYEIDNLPYHFTIFATNKENQDKILEIAERINIEM